MEEAVVSPSMRGRGVEETIMVVLMNHVRKVWGVRRVTFMSKSSRALCVKLGIMKASDRLFSIEFSDSGVWMPFLYSRLRHSCGVGHEDGGAFWHMPRDKQRAVSLICSGEESVKGTNPWSIIDPVGIYTYGDVA
jgi:hypothetical protein